MKNVKKTNLNMLEMYDDAIARGQDRTFAIYQRVDGTRQEYSNYEQYFFV